MNGSDGGPTSGVDSRVHEGGQAEVGQDEEEDQAIVERHSGRDDLRQPGAPAETHTQRGRGGGGVTSESSAFVTPVQIHTLKTVSVIFK